MLIEIKVRNTPMRVYSSHCRIVRKAEIRCEALLLILRGKWEVLRDANDNHELILEYS